MINMITFWNDFVWALLLNIPVILTWQFPGDQLGLSVETPLTMVSLSLTGKCCWSRVNGARYASLFFFSFADGWSPGISWTDGATVLISGRLNVDESSSSTKAEHFWQVVCNLPITGITLVMKD